MSLGLDGLTDDQLVELLNEACLELAVRDPLVRKLAQGCIRDVAALMPEIRKAVKGIVGAANAEELGEEEEEDDDPPLRHGSRFKSRRNPTPRPNAMPGSFSVPQNPFSNAQKTVLITVPAGHLYGSLGRTLEKVIGRKASILHTANANIFITSLTDLEILAVSTHPQMAQYHINAATP